MSDEKIASMNVYQKIHGVMSELNYLKKNGTIGFGNNTYTAITHDYVTMSLQPLIVKYRLTVIPEMIGTVIDRYQVINRKGDTSDRYETKTRVKVTITNIDNPNEKVETLAEAHGFDTQDKSPGKAYSMGTKYCLLKAFMIASGDDEEQRVEQTQEVKAERHKLETQLKELLKAQNKLDDQSLSVIPKLSIAQLREKINQYKKD